MNKNRVNGSWMLYGATGYTGTMIAEEAVRRGHRPILAGRNAEKLRFLAERLKLEWAAFSLVDESALLRAAESVDLMLHAAGPFAETCASIMDACLAGKTHYLDISNEIPVLQAAQARHHLAEKMGVSVIPGVGFGTLASNCLVSHVCDKIADPVSLEIVISPYVAQRSAGASKSTLETIARGGYVRRNGVLAAIPFGSGAKLIRFVLPMANTMYCLCQRVIWKPLTWQPASQTLAFTCRFRSIQPLPALYCQSYKNCFHGMHYDSKLLDELNGGKLRIPKNLAIPVNTHGCGDAPPAGTEM